MASQQYLYSAITEYKVAMTVGPLGTVQLFWSAPLLWEEWIQKG